MFTGLIEDVGRVGHVQESGSGFRLAVRSALAPELEPGDSLAVNGVCLTVTSAGDGTLQFDVGPETGRITTLGAWRPGQPVNLERAMRADGRFGGHFVQGHVDGIATVEQIRADGEAQWVGFSLPPALAAYVVQKGSIAI